MNVNKKVVDIIFYTTHINMYLTIPPVEMDKTTVIKDVFTRPPLEGRKIG